MSKRVRRKFTSEEKVGLIRLHLVEHKPVSEICDEHQLNVNQFYTWQKLFFENGSAAFNVRKAPKQDSRDKKIKSLEAKITNRDEGIAELMMEHVKLKKKFGLS
jgi:transposase-like protein